MAIVKRKKSLILLFLLLPVLFFSEYTLANSYRFRQQPIPLHSPEGESMLLNSTARNYRLLSSHYIEQKWNYCGIASMVIVLNSLKDKDHFFFNNFRSRQLTQDNFFTPAVQRIVHPYQVAQDGITLSTAAKILSLYPIHSEMMYASKISLSEFRNVVQTSMNSPGQFIIANFSLRRLGNDYGHFSPLAAYHSPSDSVLIMDVIDHRAARWVKLKDLFESMRILKSDGKSRGALLIASKSFNNNA